MTQAAAMAEWQRHESGKHAANWALAHGSQGNTSAIQLPEILGMPAIAAGISAPRAREATGPVRRGLVTCPNCGVRVREDRVQRHIARVHADRPDLVRIPTHEWRAHAGRILFVKFEWPDWGEPTSFESGCCMGIVLRRNATHILAVFPYRDGRIEYIWFERPEKHPRVFWDTIYNVAVRQRASTNKERRHVWTRLRKRWDEIRMKGSHLLSPPARSKVNARLLSRFAVPPPPPIWERKPPKPRHSSRERRIFVQGGLPGLGKR